ncbi:hypothetical protein Q3G72_010134 [Acer saccharum]|nr:hypothetical protein Q3G72_010134 [Acer saccharum]
MELVSYLRQNITAISSSISSYGGFIKAPSSSDDHSHLRPSSKTITIPSWKCWCYNQDDLVFNPTTSTSASASYTVVPCGSLACDALLLNDRRCHAGKCGYKVNYADGSYTKGTVMLETLTFGQMRIQNMAMGCGHNN